MKERFIACPDRGDQCDAIFWMTVTGAFWREIKGVSNTFIIYLRCAIGQFDFMGTKEKRGKPLIRTAEYWRDYNKRNQRECALPTHESERDENKNKGRD